MSTALVPVQFHGETIYAAKEARQNRIDVAVRPINDRLGLSWSNQLRRIRRTPFLAQGVAMMATPSSGGTQSMVTLPLPEIGYWLASIDTNRVREDLRPTLTLYQREAIPAVYRHMLRLDRGQQATEKARANAVARSQRFHIQLSRARSPEVRAHLYSLLAIDSAYLGIPMPALSAFEPSPSVPRIFGRTRRTVEQLELEQPDPAACLAHLMTCLGKSIRAAAGNMAKPARRALTTQGVRVMANANGPLLALRRTPCGLDTIFAGTPWARRNEDEAGWIDALQAHPDLEDRWWKVRFGAESAYALRLKLPLQLN